MGLKRRVCIGLLINDGVLFRTKKFVPDYRYSQSFVADAADEVFMVDITRGGPSEESRKAMMAYADRCFTPLVMGGHIKNMDDVKRYMDMGADMVALRRGYIENPRLIGQIAAKWGSQAVTAGIETKNGALFESGDVVEQAGRLESDGAGQIFLQSHERDGSLSGFDLETLRKVAGAVKCQVAIGTGCGGWRHMQEAFAAGAMAAVTTVIHHFTASAMRGFKQQLVSAGVEVRA